MGADRFDVTAEMFDSMGIRLGELAGRFGGLGALVDPAGAQTASDSPLSSGALRGFSETLIAALNGVAKLLQEDHAKLDQIADRYRSVDAHSAAAADSLRIEVSGGSRLPVTSAFQSVRTRSILQGLAGVDDAVATGRRTVAGASDWVQQSLPPLPPLPPLPLLTPIPSIPPTVRKEVVDVVVDAVDRVADSIEAWAEDVSRRADRVLIQPESIRR